MELSAPAFFLYLLFVVTLYASPVILIALVVAWRKGRFAKVLKSVMVGIPLLAILAQASYYADIGLGSLRLQSDKAFYDEKFPEEVSVYRGRVVGYVEKHDHVYTRYQFEVGPFLPRMIEVVLPPPDLTSVATVKAKRQEKPVQGTGPVQLVVRNAGSYYNVGDETPQNYFMNHYSHIAAQITDDPLMILTLHGGDRSHVSMFNGLNAKRPWRSQRAQVDF